MADNEAPNGEKAVALFRGDAEKVHPLARYGESRVVRALSTRIMVTDRRKTPLNEIEATLTAQAAIAYKLDPFMGELWSWVNEWTGKDGKRRRVLTIMKGRDGTLKISKKNAKDAGTHLYPPRFRMLTDEAERRRRMIPDGALAYECRVEDHLSMTAWESRSLTMKELGLARDEILEKIGDPPADIGLGVLTVEEIRDLDKTGQNKMTHEERCQKRAEMAALRKRWAPQEFEPADEASLDTDDYIIEGEWLLEEPQLKAGEELHQAAVVGAQTLYGGGMEGEVPEGKVAKGTDRPFPPETVRNKWKAGVVQFEGADANQKRGKIDLFQYIAWQLEECFPGDERGSAKRHSVIAYLTEGRTDSTKELSGAELIATERWLDSSEPEGPGSGLKPRIESRKEAAAIVEVRMKELGQGELL